MLVLLAGWTLTTVAMMLPASLPLMTSFHTLTCWRVAQGRLVALLLAALGPVVQDQHPPAVGRDWGLTL